MPAVIRLNPKRRSMTNWRTALDATGATPKIDAVTTIRRRPPNTPPTVHTPVAKAPIPPVTASVTMRT